MADSRDAVYQAYDASKARFEAKYCKAMECLHKDKELRQSEDDTGHGV